VRTKKSNGGQDQGLRQYEGRQSPWMVYARSGKKLE